MKKDNNTIIEELQNIKQARNKGRAIGRLAERLVNIVDACVSRVELDKRREELRVVLDKKKGNNK